MKLAFWTWAVDVLDAWRLAARTRKLEALSDSLIHRYNWKAKEKLIDKSMGRARERQRMAYSQFPAASSYTALSLLKENDERKH